MVLDLPPGPQDNSDKGTVYVGIPYSKRNNPDGAITGCGIDPWDVSRMEK